MATLVQLGDYEIDCAKELGRGTFGVVYCGKHKKAGRKVAVKKMVIASDSHGSLAMREIRNLSKLEDHVNIMKMEDYFYHETSFWICMEFCDEGDLNDYMDKRKPKMDSRLKIMFECACALTYMHERPSPVVHRDIKPGNILVKIAGGKPTVKLTDLGLSRIVDSDEMAKTAVFTSNVGTPGFMAPEQYQDEPYNYRVDIFAMGLVYLSLLVYESGKLLIPKGEKCMNIVPIGQEMAMKHKGGHAMPTLVTIKSSDDGSTKKMKQMIAGMCSVKPNDRLSMRQAMEILAGIIGIEAVQPPTPVTEKLRRAALPATKDITANEDEKSASLSGASDKGFGVLLAALREQLGERAREKEQEEALGKLGGLMMIIEALGGKKFEIGETVVLDTDIDRAKQLQQNHGEWVDGMERYLGMEGRIIDTGVGTFRVKFPDGKSVIWNAGLLQKPGLGSSLKRPPYAKARHVESARKYAQYDLVRITKDKAEFKKFQESIGVWRDDLIECANHKGVVVRIDGDGDIVVYVHLGVHSFRFAAHPDALTKIEVEGDIESGDLVYVKEDELEIKNMQSNHGGWNPKMKSVLGKLALVEEVGYLPNGSEVAKIEADGHDWLLNIKALVLLSKSDEMFEAVLAKKLSDQMEAIQRIAGDSDNSCCIQ